MNGKMNSDSSFINGWYFGPSSSSPTVTKTNTNTTTIRTYKTSAPGISKPSSMRTENSTSNNLFSSKRVRAGKVTQKQRLVQSKLSNINSHTLASPNFPRSPTIATTKHQKVHPSASGLTAVQEKIICSIFEISKDTDSRIGLCVINYSTGEMIISDFMDSQIFIRTVHKIQIHQPTEILLPSSSFLPNISKLATIIKFNVSGSVKVTEVSLKHYNSQEGLTAIEEYGLFIGNEKNLTVEKFVDKKFALCAVSAAIKHTKRISTSRISNESYSFQNLRIKYEGTENTMLIDPRTSKGLELVENALEKKGMSLFKFLDSTVTKMGKRALRNNILQPLTQEDGIIMRLQCVGELQDNNQLLADLRAEMRSCQDLDALYSKLLSADHAAIRPDQKLNYVILLKDSIELASKLGSLLENNKVESRLLKEVKEICQNDAIENIRELISTYINDDCTWASTNLDLQNQRSYAVKSGANGLLDVSRQIYKGIIDDIINEIESLSQRHSLNLKHSYDSTRGFFIKLKRQGISDISELAPVFINKVVKKNYVEFTTLQITKLNARLDEVMSEIMLISEQIVRELLKEIVKKISVLFMIAEAVSILDLLSCFAYNSAENNYCIPEFSNKMVFKSARHPILEKFLKTFIPNDTVSIKESSAIQIITGCNASGKSVYLKQIAILNIMAQMGSPVPADYACFPIFNRLHARVCNDTIEVNSSTFSSEMKEMAYFLHDIDSNTLMVLDELGRGSSIGDGFAVSLAITEHLVGTNCTAFVSTHFGDIPEILTSKPSVVHLQMTAEVVDKTLTMHYKVSRTASDIKNYGLRVVQNLFPREIMDNAYEIGSLLKSSKKKISNANLSKEHKEEHHRIANQIKQIHNLVEILKELSKHENISLKSLKATQSNFISTFED